jgi:hypothetical protein
MISPDNRAEFELLRPHGVRKRIEAALYDPQKHKQADEWLEEVEHGPDRALMREQIEIAREAKDIARSADKRATIALWISGTAALGVFAAIIVPHFWK